MNPEPENPRLLTDEELLTCSLISEYCLKQVKDVMVEACIAQDAKTARFIKGSADA